MYDLKLRRSSGGIPRILDGSICLIISNMEAIGMDTRRHVMYHLIITEKWWYREKIITINVNNSIPHPNVNNPIPHPNTRGVFKLSYSRSKL